MPDMPAYLILSSVWLWLHGCTTRVHVPSVRLSPASALESQLAEAPGCSEASKQWGILYGDATAHARHTHGIRTA